MPDPRGATMGGTFHAWGGGQRSRMAHRHTRYTTYLTPRVGTGLTTLRVGPNTGLHTKTGTLQTGIDKIDHGEKFNLSMSVFNDPRVLPWLHYVFSIAFGCILLASTKKPSQKKTNHSHKDEEENKMTFVQ
jgi:hypothetical protein